MKFFLKEDDKVFEQTKSAATSMIADIFGYDALLVGDHFDQDFLEVSRIANKWRVAQSLQKPLNAKKFDLITDLCSMSISPEKIDLIVLPFILDSTDRPHEVLDQMIELLVTDGYLLLIGVASWSFGRNNFFSKINSLTSRRNSNLSRMVNLKTKLKENNLAIEKLESKYFGRFCHFQDIKNESNNFLNKRLAICFGEVYLLLAKKNLMPVTPLRNLFDRDRKILKSKVLET